MINKNSYLKIFWASFLFLLVFSFSAGAAGLGDAFKTKDGGGSDPLDAVAGKAGYNIKAEASDINAIISVIIQTVLGLLGVIFLCLIIYAGILWMTAEGDEQKIEKAQKILRNAVIGLIITVSAYAISFFVINASSGPMFG
jgi:hypothetical protein